MKYMVKFFLLSLLILTLHSCEKDEGKLPEIRFITDTGYTSSDATVTAGSDVTIGIHAAKSEEENVLKKFKVTSSTDGATAVTLEDINLSTDQEDVYEADYTFTIPPAAGHTYKLTFTVTNSDGQTNQISLTLTAY